jgi:hypothetical protein
VRVRRSAAMVALAPGENDRKSAAGSGTELRSPFPDRCGALGAGLPRSTSSETRSRRPKGRRTRTAAPGGSSERARNGGGEEECGICGGTRRRRVGVGERAGGGGGYCGVGMPRCEPTHFAALSTPTGRTVTVLSVKKKNLLLYKLFAIRTTVSVV